MTLDHDLQARPIYHHQRDSTDAHPTIVFAALAVSRWIEDAPAGRSGDSSAPPRRYRSIEIQAANHTITAADPLGATRETGPRQGVGRW